MKTRNALLLLVLLFLLSTAMGLAALGYLQRYGVPPALARIVPAAQPGPTSSPTVTPIPATPTSVPPLATPTSTSTLPPTATPSPTLPPTPTSTLTPALAPTPEPAARLADAYVAKRNGDYFRAQVDFRQVLETPAKPEEAAEASYQLGVCALLAGDQDAARSLLSQFIREYPDDRRSGAAHFHLARAFEGANDYVAAIEHYLAYLTYQDVLADLVYAEIGDAYMEIGDHRAAAQSYELALEQALDLEQQFDLREQIALAYSAAGDYSNAILWLQSIAERSQNVYRLARIWYLMGQVHRLAGQEDQAINAFTQAVDGDPRPGYAHAALVALLDAYVPVDEYQRGLIDYYAGSYGAAVGAFYRYMETNPDYDFDAHYYVALSYMQSGSLDLAVLECDRAFARFPSTASHWGDLWLLKGRALARQGLLDDAVETFIGFAEDNPAHPLAPDARWEAAWLLEQESRLDEAADAYTVLADKHVNASRAPTARFRAGLCRYRSGDREAARIAWQELTNGYPAAVDSVRGSYWLGKVLWELGDVGEARRLLQELAAAYPRDYYGMRAAHLVSAQGEAPAWISAPPTLHLTSDEESEEKVAADWLREWAGAPDDFGSVLLPKIAEDVRFRRAMEMLALELRPRAVEELETLRKDLDQDPLSLFQFALVTRDVGLYAPSLRAAIALVALAPEDSVLHVPRLIRRLAFPVYFSDLVTSECAEYGIDPLLMFALIRQESVFDDQVSSWAGAVGLSQIMPSTGEWIAEMMPWPDYQEGLLTRAHLNVKFGAWFLDRILDGTGQNVMGALAGYNGGPANSTHWLSLSNGDPDLFVEVITRNEPQLYVRQIYRHYQMYVYLYGE